MEHQFPEDPDEVRRRAVEFIAVMNAVEMDFSGSAEAWRYGGGRDLSRLVEKARRGVVGQSCVGERAEAAESDSAGDSAGC